MITCALWDIESRELDRRQRGPKARVAYLIRAWSPHSKDGHITQAIRTPPQLTSAQPSETFHSTKLTKDIEASRFKKPAL